MQRRFFLIGGVLGLSACGGRLNPVNWFRRRAPQVTEEAAYVAPVDPRGLVARVLSVEVEPVSSGVILRASGLAPAQGYHDAALVALPIDETGTRTFEFRLAEPSTPTGPGPERSRTITVATAISFYQLEQITALRVAGAENAMVVRP